MTKLWTTAESNATVVLTAGRSILQQMATPQPTDGGIAYGAGSGGAFGGGSNIC